MSVLVLTTGGTIGAMPYRDIKRQPLYKIMPPDGSNGVRRVLEQNFGRTDLRFISLEPRDSKHIDAGYRRNICSCLEEAHETNILITHGTDTLLQTASFLYGFQQKDSSTLQSKTILLTGAMVALSCGAESDGIMNLRYALEQLDKSLSPGIYIVLCDYTDIDTSSGWAPRLYSFEPGKYEEIFDRNNMHRNRLRMVSP